ncbi:M16 family metallopeptidase [Paraneptunicella aestuarii]|uniref:M16 family metallopeptidase n=1 Tax=Paraneptunicella aestuarii TaxID=2831148 RepID=UPI0038CD5B56
MNIVKVSLPRPLVGALIALPLLFSCQSPDYQANVNRSLPDGVQLVDIHQPRAGEVGIPYERYRLDNGLTVILHKDDSDPLVHVDVTYHVGSAREEPGKSGFAHFFEHMMFQGSENVADEQHFNIITEAGGSMNGTTTNDRTNYYQTVPSNQLEKVLWLEADRMGYLLGAVTQEKFEVQRETVKNERAQRIDNQPYGLLDEKVSEALYPANHPYSWPVIGYVEDLDRVNVNDLKQFFQRWYGPNNAVLTIGGDIDTQQTLDWVKKYFGSISKGTDIPKLDKTLVDLPENRYITLPDDVHLPLLQVTFPTVHIRHEDEAPLDVLSDILGGGKTSLFYKNMVKDGMAIQALVNHPCRELACQFELAALVNPQKQIGLAEIEKRIRGTLVEFEQRGVTEEDIQRTKAHIESMTIYALQSVSGKVSTLAYNQYMSDSPDMVQDDLERYRAVSVEDVMRVYKRYIKDKPAVVLSVVPRGQEQLAAAKANYTFPQRQFDVNANKDFVARTNAPDDFDRSKMPPAGKAPVVHVPDFWQVQWENGVKVLGHQTSETPTVSLTLNMEGGPLLDPYEKAGLSDVTAQMMEEATVNYSNEQMANELALIGSSISFSSGGRNTRVQVSSLTKNLDKTLQLLQEKLFNPAFKQQDFQRLMLRNLQNKQQSMKQANVLAERAMSQLLYGAGNRMGLPDDGTLNTLAKISLDDVKDFYQRYYSPHMASLVVVGDVEQQEVLSKLDFLQKWQGAAYDIPPYSDFPQPDNSKIYLINKPGAAQSVVRVFKSFLPYDATGEQFRSKLMNFPLGGSFNSRINLNLREDKGYTYGAGSTFLGGKTLGYFRAGGAMKHENSADALTELLFEIDRFHEQGMTAEELAFMRSAYTMGDALSYETPANKAGFLLQLNAYSLTPDYVAEQNDIINSISLDEINQLAKTHLDSATMQIMVVGDVSLLQPQLQDIAKKLNRHIELLSVVE